MVGRPIIREYSIYKLETIRLATQIWNHTDNKISYLENVKNFETRKPKTYKNSALENQKKSLELENENNFRKLKIEKQKL